MKKALVYTGVYAAIIAFIVAGWFWPAAALGLFVAVLICSAIYAVGLIGYEVGNLIIDFMERENEK